MRNVQQEGMVMYFQNGMRYGCLKESLSAEREESPLLGLSLQDTEQGPQ